MDDLGFVPNSDQAPQAQPQEPKDDLGFMPSKPDEGLGFTPDQEQPPEATPTSGMDRGVMTAALEGAGQGIAGPLAPLAEKRYGKVKSEDIRATEEAHPIAHTLGEIAGFGASMATGIGEAGLLAKAGEGALQGAKYLGLGNKLALGAAKAATEMGLMQAGNEATQAILDAPNSTGAIASHIGLSALLGGVTGGAFSAAGMGLNKILEGPVVKDFMGTLSALRGGVEVIPEKKSIGYKLAKAWNDKIDAGTLGGLMGGAVGESIFPGFGGYYVGKNALGPVMTSVIKPLLEKYPNLDEKAFQQAIKVASNISKGNETLNKVTKTFLMPGGSEVLSNILPSDKDLDKLDERAKELNDNPQGLMNIPGESSSILPDHAMMLSKTAGDTIAYLNKQRPNPMLAAPLDTTHEVAPSDQLAYKRTLSLAQQPLSVFKHIKDGTLMPKDMQDLNAMYPDYVKKIQSQVASSIATQTHNGVSIPYHTRLSMGLFLMTPLDSTMRPESIQAAQPKPQSPNQGPQTPKSGEKSKIGNKTNKMYETASQSAESDRSGRKS